MKTINLIIIISLAISCATFSQEKIDKMPEIKGGIQALAQNVVYPASAKKEGIMGTVMVKAVIDAQGNVASAEVAKGVNGDLDAAALKAVKLTKFVPGEKEGKNVQAEVTIPIKFKLDDKKKS